MTTRIGGSIRNTKVEGAAGVSVTGVISPAGPGNSGAQVVVGDGVNNLLELLQASPYLADISTVALTVDDPPGTRGPEEAGLAFVPRDGTEVIIYIGVQVRCIEANEPA